MSIARFTDEQMMAYADGELDAKTASEIDMAIVNDLGLADRIAVFAETRSIAKKSLDQQLSEPVPAALNSHVLALLAAGNAPKVEPKTAASAIAQTPNIKAASNDNKRRNWFELGIAASVALMLGLGLGAGERFVGMPDTASQIAIGHLGHAELGQLLASAPSGEERGLQNGGRFKAIATFTDGQGALCREFEIDGSDSKAIVSVVCYDGAKWGLQFAVATSQNDQGYAPASSLELLENYYSASGAGEVLSAEAEKAALKSLNQNRE